MHEVSGQVPEEVEQIETGDLGLPGRLANLIAVGLFARTSGSVDPVRRKIGKSAS
jgi:hypothetical protein